MKVGARNQAVGTVTAIAKDKVMCQVKLDVPASQLQSVMTTESADEMGLKVGDKARVVVKAIHVLLIKE